MRSIISNLAGVCILATALISCAQAQDVFVPLAAQKKDDANRPKVRLPRLKHSGKGWDKNFGAGGDNNMLVQFATLVPLAAANKSETITTDVLARLKASSSPPLVLVTGTDTFTLSDNEKKILRELLLEKGGMLLGDNLGGDEFHTSFLKTMREITGVAHVVIPRDDTIHKKPFELDALPLVVAHGGTKALGWKVKDRWAVYYHPGALTSAWRDDHAGVKREVWQNCYMLGANIIYYAYVEKHKWLEAQNKR